MWWPFWRKNNWFLGILLAVLHIGSCDTHLAQKQDSPGVLFMLEINEHQGREIKFLLLLLFFVFEEVWFSIQATEVVPQNSERSSTEQWKEWYRTGMSSWELQKQMDCLRRLKKKEKVWITPCIAAATQKINLSVESYFSYSKARRKKQYF